MTLSTEDRSARHDNCSAGYAGIFSLSVATALLAPSIAWAQAEIPVTDLSNETPVDLGTLVMTATGFEQNVENAPASISVVPAEALEGERFTDLTDALNGVQGVVTTGIANEDDIFIRGLPGEYTLILVDGRRQGTRESRTNGSSGFEQSFVPPPAAIERIEIVRGPMSSLYGSDSIGGVINIITKPVADSWTGEITVGTDMPEDDDFGDEQTLSFYASGPLIGERLGLQIWGRKLDRDGSEVEGAEFEADEHDVTGRLTFAATPDHRFYAEYGTTELDNTEPNALGFRKYSRDHAAIGYDGYVAGWGIDMDLQRETGERTIFARETTDLAFAEDLRSPEIETTVFDLSAARQLEFRGFHTVTVGYQRIDAELTDQNPGTGIESDEIFDIGQQALYLEDEWRLTPRFALTGGVRLNRHDEYDDTWTPRLYAVLNATDALTVKGGVSTGFKAPNIREVAPGYLYTTGGGGCLLDPTSAQPCGVIVGDPDLKAETSTNYELGVLYGQDRWSFGATYFHNELDDKIANARVFNDDGSYALLPQDPRYTLFYHYNIGEAEIDGVELTASWQPTDRIALRGTYTYTDSEQLNGDYVGLPLARTPEHLASLRVDYETALAGLDLWGAATYHGTEVNAGFRIGEDGSAITNDEGEILARKYGAYTLLDAGLSYEVTDNVSLNGAIYDLLDEEIAADEFGTVRAGRSLWLGATTRF
ncbi:TonB-dependent receptor [uncultured Jannaschia sp.]|uniref:TonB-dependent receptor domain-containing protein n=1 Tax=uncultured Jannaschia sp. TaxID=293347 RepID=UPI00261175CE|nr:TonB-dependent receptor [uncultured Jannaschia sp.]